MRSCHMLHAFLFSVFIFVQVHAFAQKDEFFKGIDFDSSYTIVGLAQGYGKSVDTFSRFCFVIDDPVEMDSLKKKWVYTRPVSNIHFEDVSFDIFVVRFSRLAAPSGIIYPKQRIINSGNGHWHPFDTAELVRLHNAHPLHFHTEIKRFDTWNEYIAFGNSIVHDSSLLFFFEPSLRFEGMFDIITYRTSDESSPIFKLRDINEELEKLTSKSNFETGHVLNDSFNIAHRDKVKITVHCSKDLYDHYNVKGREKGPWQPAAILMTIFWRESALKD